MPSKSKDAHVFKVGDPAIVRSGQGRVINSGKVVVVTPMQVVFEGPTSEGTTHRWVFRRKGTRWVQLKRDNAWLEPTP